MERRDKINYYLDLAEVVSKRGTCLRKAYGAVIVKNDKIVSKKHNTKMKTNNILNHAEIIAIISASEKINDWRLNDCDMYVTLEPCPMCAGAIQQSRIRKIYIGSASNVKSKRCCRC